MVESQSRSGESRGEASTLEGLVADGIEADLFTGAAAAVGTSEGIDWQTTAGVRDPRSEDPDPVTGETLFDAASTTKAVVTTTTILRLVEEGVLALSAPLSDYIPPLSGTERGEIPLHRLMTHTSGLQPYHYDEEWESPEDARQGVYDADLVEAEPGERFAYSCLNFVHLVDAARRATDRTLADLAREYVFEQAGMESARLGPLEEGAPPAAVTYEYEHADSAFVGEIHDPIARAFAGESGNAGLFTTATDMGRFAAKLLDDRRDVAGSGPAAATDHLLAPGTIDRMTREWIPDLGRPHGLGWRLAQECYPAPNWSLESFGHTGYTGASIWLDPEDDRFAVLLTNEVFCGKENGMIQFRERFHGAVAGERY
ncbi:MAG: serine hydrolase domain-containing protein [Haloplanus sp.]